MTKLLTYTMCILLISPRLAYSEDANLDISHGSSLFARIGEKFYMHFRIKSISGEFITINKDSAIGKYIINALSKKTLTGWVQWKEAEPRLAAGSTWTVLGECDFSDKENGPEIRLNSVMKKAGYPTESFWNVLVFEVNNLQHLPSHQENLANYKATRITRNEFVNRKIKMEYLSALNTQNFQNRIWKEFCRDKRIAYSRAPWRFPENTTFEQWIHMLEKTDGGKKYLDAYK